MPTKYLFIDAGCLDARISQIEARFCPGEKLNPHWGAISAGYQKVFFYDALPGQRKIEEDEEFKIRRAEAEARHEYWFQIEGYSERAVIGLAIEDYGLEPVDI